MLVAGQRVQLHSLQGRAELNGISGTVLAYFEDKERFSIAVDDEAKMLLKPANLQPVDEQRGMDALLRRRPDEARRTLSRLAIERLREHQRASDGAAGLLTSAASQKESEARLHADTRVWQIDGVFSPSECELVLRAAEAVGARRGWDRVRHNSFATTDLPLACVPAVEPFVRATVFRRVMRPLARVILGASFLPEHLTLHDCFYVKYSCECEQQRALEMHADGTIFSFNILLSAPESFEGGGTHFERTGDTIRPPGGSALGHNGRLRHCGLGITSGERYLLVGFVGCVDPDAHFSVRQPDLAAHRAFAKFGDGAWDRSPDVDTGTVVAGTLQAANPKKN